MGYIVMRLWESRLKVICAEEYDAIRLSSAIRKLKTEADRNDVGFALGCERYMFDTTLEVEENEVLLDGWVKWCFHDAEAVAIFGRIRLFAPNAEITLDYAEYGCLVYGAYEHKDGCTVHRYLPEDKFPEWEDVDGPDYCYDDIVDDAFKTHFREYEL